MCTISPHEIYRAVPPRSAINSTRVNRTVFFEAIQSTHHGSGGFSPPPKKKFRRLVWWVKTRRAPSRRCSRYPRVYGHTTTAMRIMSAPPPPLPPSLPPSFPRCSPPLAYSDRYPYRNIFKLIEKELNIDPFTPWTQSAQYSPEGLEVSRLALVSLLTNVKHDDS